MRRVGVGKRSIVNASVDRWRKLGRLLSVDDMGPYDDRVVGPAPTGSDAEAAWQRCRQLPQPDARRGGGRTTM